MTNDLSTLSGALLEMKDQLIYELGEKGVTASYSSTTGLLGLIGEISNIQTGGSCYHIELDQSSYTTDGSLTVSATVQKDYALCSGETVTFTGGTSTVTATTDSSGIATATVTFTTDGTLTATIGGVSDTATVTVQTYLFYDDCSVDNTNQYTSTFVYWDRGQPTKTLSFVTDHYELTRNVSNFILMQLPMSANDDFMFTADILPSSTSMDNGGGMGIGVNTSNKGIGFHQANSSSNKHLLLYNPQEGQGGVVSNVITPNYVVDDYHTHRITKSGASFKYEVLHNDIVLFTYTKDDLATVFSSDVYPAISMGKNGTLKIKNIKVESL